MDTSCTGIKYIAIMKRKCWYLIDFFRKMSSYYLEFLYRFLGTPFFHSMVARAQASTSDVSVLLDPEILLLPEFITILNHVVRLDYDWLLIASSRNASDFPFHLDTDAKHWLSDKDKQIRIKKV